jgi:DNA-binding HxlR family transcriptional regulator
MLPDGDEVVCPIREILGRIGGRWTIDILMNLLSGPQHFADLDRRIPKISRRMLTLTLRSLERDGLLSRRAAGRAGSMVFYELTDLGRELSELLQTLTNWSRVRRDDIYAARDRFDGRERFTA